MAITVNWGNPEKTYTIFKFMGKWTWDEYYASIKAGSDLIENVPYTVNILLDLSECNLFPSNLLSHAGASMKQPPRAFDLAVIVSTSGFVNAIMGLIERLYGKKTRFKVVKTMDEARTIFAEHDSLNPVGLPSVS